MQAWLAQLLNILSVQYLSIHKKELKNIISKNSYLQHEHTPKLQW
jgi:hypothetical protein